ncbi:MAG: bifunctional isocitrate dehydrogenase kinase/phosphatase [Herpetosiphon sp.]
MKSEASIVQVGQDAAGIIVRGFTDYQASFTAITKRARARFQACDWRGTQTDALERLTLYEQVIAGVAGELRRSLGDTAHEKHLWHAMKATYGQFVYDRPDAEIAETFYNSVTRRIWSTVGVDELIEFVAVGNAMPLEADDGGVYTSYVGPNVVAAVRTMLGDRRWDVPYQRLHWDVEHVATAIIAGVKAITGGETESIDMLNPLFYRGKCAYLVGRVHSRSQIVPLVLPLLNGPDGIVTDAVLLHPDEVAIIFSFARSYFMVDAPCPRHLVRFLQTILPVKPLSELYISIGFNKHGKTELYRDLFAYLDRSDDRFQVARGEKGMVMAVFTMPGYHQVFKIIKDTFSHQKTTTRQEVIQKYALVFKHERAGRLIDAQVFEHLRFAKSRFDPTLLQELLVDCRSSVVEDGNWIVIKHLYTERLLIPLNLYVREAPPEAAYRAVIDYGQSIKDLAAANIFPGDTLLKNFGVTRHGRVVFYDFDDLRLLEDCNFRDVPEDDDDDPYSSKPWFFAAEQDVFPAEFETFLGLGGELRTLFVERHGDLFGVPFWTAMQARHAQGEVVDVFPYPHGKRLLQERDVEP